MNTNNLTARQIVDLLTAAMTYDLAIQYAVKNQCITNMMLVLRAYGNAEGFKVTFEEAEQILTILTIINKREMIFF